MSALLAERRAAVKSFLRPAEMYHTTHSQSTSYISPHCTAKLTSVRTVFVGVVTLTGIFEVALIVLVAVAAHQALHAFQLL
jgi:hypothetical protein